MSSFQAENNENELYSFIPLPPQIVNFSIGRKKTLYVSFIIVLASSVALSWAQNFVMYVILRFIIGAANAGIFMTGFVIGWYKYISFLHFHLKWCLKGHKIQ